MRWDKDTVVVAASFGTVYDRTASDNITSIENYFSMLYPDNRIVRAYTSPTIRRILKNRGISIESVKDCLHILADQGVRKIVVQPTHLIPGEEYNKLRADSTECADLFDEISVGTPLLSSKEDIIRAARIISVNFHPQLNEAVLLMGHGSSHPANSVYHIIADVLKNDLNEQQIFMATIDGTPTLQDGIADLKLCQCKTVHLVPLMLVAGEHAIHDMAGDTEQSWKNQLLKEGFEPICHFCGLGEIEEIRQLYAEHLEAAERLK